MYSQLYSQSPKKEDETDKRKKDNSEIKRQFGMQSKVHFARQRSQSPKKKEIEHYVNTVELTGNESEDESEGEHSEGEDSCEGSENEMENTTINESWNDSEDVYADIMFDLEDFRSDVDLDYQKIEKEFQNVFDSHFKGKNNEDILVNSCEFFMMKRRSELLEYMIISWITFSFQSLLKIEDADTKLFQFDIFKSLLHTNSFHFPKDALKQFDLNEIRRNEI